MRRLTTLGLALTLALGLGACTGEDTAGTGSLALELAGGTSLRSGFPHTEGGVTHAFVDGWELSFDKYIVSVGDVVLTDPVSGAEQARWDQAVLVDLKASASATAALHTFEGLPALRFDVAFAMPAPKQGVELRDVQQSDADEMVQQGWTLLAAGEAKKGAETVRFRLGLPAPIRYERCKNGKDDSQGIAIEANKTTGAFINAHAIHLFWDSLSFSSQNLRFDAFAAVAGTDGLVDSEELKTQDLTDLKDAQGQPLKDGGTRVVYNDGGLLPPAEQDLFHYVALAARQSAHFNGLGLCSEQPLD